MGDYRGGPIKELTPITFMNLIRESSSVTIINRAA